LVSQGVGAVERERIHVRYQGTDTALVVTFGTIDAVRRSRLHIGNALRS
jgi:hypothetical protein